MPRSTRGKATAPRDQEEQIRKHTPPEVNRRIDRDTDMRIDYYSKKPDDEIGRRIEQLDEERDLERFLEANAATLSLLGVIMGIAIGRKWLLLPVVTGALLFNHAIHGWCPPVNIFRRMGVRTREEIDREKYALKTLRGDFDELRKTSRH